MGIQELQSCGVAKVLSATQEVVLLENQSYDHFTQAFGGVRPFVGFCFFFVIYNIVMAKW